MTGGGMLTRTGAGIVIVGGGIAAVTAAHALRDEGFEAAIAIIADESHLPYSRPALSKGVVAGHNDSPFLPEATHGADIIRARACELDPGGRRVRLDDGSWMAYDGLVVASGSRARSLGNPAHSVRLRTLDDARLLRDRLHSVHQVIIVGAGALGMELASQCRDFGCAVTLVSRTPPMQSMLGTMLSAALRAAAAEQGVAFVTAPDISVTATGVQAAGRYIDADLVITAVGDEPEVDWLRSSGLLNNEMVIGDEDGRVADGIVAAGDVLMTDRGANRTRTPLWTSAIEQARRAARTMVHGPDPQQKPLAPYFWTEQFGHTVKAVGELPVRGGGHVLSESDQGWLARWDRTAIAFDHRIALPRLRRAAQGD